MTIEHISQGATKEQYIQQINKNFNALDGKYKEIDILLEEINALISSTSCDTKMLIGVGLGNTTSTYTNWTHVKTYDGYSIWKIAVSNYAHNSINLLLFDDGPLTYMGVASSVGLSSFDYVLYYDGASYTDYTTEAASEVGTPFTILSDTNDFLYIGDASTFGKIDFAFSQWGSGLTLKIEYSKGSSSWQELLTTLDNLVDNTSNFASDGLMEYDVPGDWATDTVDGNSAYWIRISTTTAVAVEPKAYYITPGDSVYSLLSLSNTQALNKLWAWCYYSNEVYVTIPNAGYAAYEGKNYIKSSSSSANLKNYFVYYHQYTLDHEDSTFVLNTHPDFEGLDLNATYTDESTAQADFVSTYNLTTGGVYPVGLRIKNNSNYQASAAYYSRGGFIRKYINPGGDQTYNNTGWDRGLEIVHHLRNNAGTISVMEGLSVAVGSYSDGADVTATITDLYGMKLAGIKQTSTTITNAYGLYITGIQGTNAFDIYAKDASAKNYFAGNIVLGTTSVGTNLAKGMAVGLGTAPTTQPADAFQMWAGDQAAGNCCAHFMTEGGATIKLYQETALTAQETTITHTAPGTPDYAIQDLTQTSPYGFVTKDEGNSVLKVIANLQTRLDELETRLQNQGHLA